MNRTAQDAILEIRTVIIRRWTCLQPLLMVPQSSAVLVRSGNSCSPRKRTSLTERHTGFLENLLAWRMYKPNHRGANNCYSNAAKVKLPTEQNPYRLPAFSILQATLSDPRSEQRTSASKVELENTRSTEQKKSLTRSQIDTSS